MPVLIFCFFAVLVAWCGLQSGGKSSESLRIDNLTRSGRKKCYAAIRKSARHPSTVDIHHFAGYARTLRDDGTIMIRQDFSAKNSFGAEFTHTAICFVGDDLFDFFIYEKDS